MAVRITHSKVSGKPQGSDPARVYGTHWDEDHTVTGLENVDNTSDADKPVSSATQAALDLKLNITAARERLTANRTYYIRTDGNNSNDGLSNTSGGAFLTVQKAIDVVFGTLDLAGFNVDIQLGAGTYTGNINASTPQVGAGDITISGDTTPSNTSNYILTSASGTTITASTNAKLFIQGFELRAATQGMTAVNGGFLQITGFMRFGTCGSAHMRANNGTIQFNNMSYEIVGSGAYHYWSSPNAYITGGNATVTVPVGSSIAFTVFAYAERMSQMTVAGITFTVSGTVTGQRYLLDTLSLIYVNGAGANYFPGSTAGANNGNGAVYF